MRIEYWALLISLLSAVGSVVALMHARTANEIAKKSNELSRHYNLLPRRLDARKLAIEFTRFCEQFRTRFTNGIAKSSSELLDHRQRFLDEYGSLGPLEMPKVEASVKEIADQAVTLQRVIDRSRASNPQPLGSEYASIDEQLDALLIYFNQQRNELPELFDEYLSDA